MRTFNLYKLSAIPVGFFLLALVFPGKIVAQAWYNSNWSYRKAITIDYTKVGAGPHTNFPLLISRTDVDLRDRALANGNDILFTSSDGTTKLSHEIESYTSASGAIVAWVKIPSLSSSANTTIYMYYGNASATSQQNVTGTWDASFKGVYHLNNSFADATSNANNGTNTGTTNVTGKISNGRGYVRSDGSDFIQINGLMSSPTSFTLSAWATLTTADPNGAEIISLGDHAVLRYDEADASKTCGVAQSGASSWNTTGSGINYAGTGWHYVVYTFASNSQKVYVDGAQVATSSYSGSPYYTGGGTNTFIGKHGNANINMDFDGTIDEARVANAGRSAGWVLTEYNNQNSPSTFYSVGAQTQNCSQPAPPTVTTPVSYCLNTAASPLTATGSNLVWSSGTTSGSVGGTSTLATTTFVDGRYGPSTNRTDFTTTTGNVTITSVDYYIPAWQSVNGLVLSLYNSSGTAIATSSTAITQTAGASSLTITNDFNYTITTPGDYSIRVSAGYGNIGGDNPSFPITEATGTINVTGSGGGYRSFNNIQFTASWSSSTAPTPSTTSAGTTNYTVTQTVSGCVSNAATIAVIVNAPPAISQIPSSNLVLNYKFKGNANDETGTNNGTLQNNPSQASDRFGNAASAYSLNGSTQYISTANSYSNPTNFTVSIWFKTSTASGGRLIGFGNLQTGSSTSYDRHLYMSNSGQIYFGVFPGYVVTINSPLSYNDNTWHMATATLSSTTGMVLYIDGAQVASNANTGVQNYAGYWRIGYDNVNAWTSAPSSYYFNGTLDDALVYHTALNASQVATLYNSPDGAGNNGPVCAGSSLNLTSTAVSGATYAWTGPNSFSSSSQNPSFSYLSAYSGVYTVSVTSNGCTSTAYTNVKTSATSSEFSYAGSPYCKNAGTATVTFSGATGGTYSSTAGLSINATTGAVTLGTSTAGSYVVTYTVAGGCSSTANITITAVPSATISYAGTPFCKSLSSGQPVTQTGTSGGTYSSTAGLTINSSTGAITPSASTAGTYTVTYTMAAGGGCSQQTATTSVTITAVPSATISYAGTPFCKSLSGGQPVTQTGTSGGTYSSTAGLTINSSTGAITPSTSTAGTYTVTYTMAAGGGCSQQTATTSVTIASMPSVSGSSTETCVGGSSGTISASASGGQSPYTYSLDAGSYQSSSTFSGLAAGTYTLNVKSNEGCIASNSVTVNPYANSTDDQNAAGTNSWIGHAYDGTNFSSYIGHFTEAETFNELFGGNTTCFDVVSNSQTRSIYTETFSVKFRMNSTKRGLYIANLGSDDGSRLTVDGTLLYNNWADQAFSTKASVLFSLNGNSSLLYEYYENGGGNQVVFQNLTLVLANTLSGNTTQSICMGNTGSAISGDTYGALPSGITLSGTGYQWSYSTTPGGARTNIAGATQAGFTPSTSAAPFNTPGTYYVYRNAVLSSTNNVSPNPYTATNESNAAVIMVSAAPSATISYAGSPYYTNGGTASVTFSGTGGGTYSSTAGLSINASTGTVTLATTTPGTYTVTYTVAASGGCSIYTTTGNITVIRSIKTWDGGAGTSNWGDGNNWNPDGVPSILDSIELNGANTININITAEAKNLVMNNAGLFLTLNSSSLTVQNSLTITAGSFNISTNTLKIGAGISNSGTLVATDGTIELNGTSSQTIPASVFSGNAVKGLTINNTSGVSLAGTLDITDVLTVSNGSFVTNGYLTLKSTATYTARVAPVTSVAATPINGNVTVERYVPGRRRYRLITSPVTTSAASALTTGQEALSIWGNWQNSGSNSTPIVGNFITGGSSADGFDTQTPNASLFTYDDVNRAYVGYTTANGKNTKYTPLKAGVAYYMFVYGDRQNTITTSSPHNTVLKATGTLLTGDQVYNTGSSIPLSGVTGRYTLLGNPFASPIDWATITRNNIENTYWGWDPNLSGTGGYVTVSSLGDVVIVSPYSGSTGLNQYIQSGQGFFVKTAGSSPSMTIREQDKVANFNPTAFRVQGNGLPLLAINLQYASGGTNVLADGVVTVFDNAFSNQVAAEDASKMSNYAEGIAIDNAGTLLSIDARKMPLNNDTLFLSVSNLTKPQYTLQVFAAGMEGSQLAPYLQDNYLNSSQPLLLSDTNRIDFNVNLSVPASYAANRFRIVYRSSIVLPVHFISVTASLENDEVPVKWNVAEETAMRIYEVERSADGINFLKIGKVNSKGNNTVENYEWRDADPADGINYYRIRAVEADGSCFLSNVIPVKIENSGSVLKVFPNPVQNGKINFYIRSVGKGRYNIILSDLLGRQLLTESFEHPGGSLNKTISLDKSLPGGIYQLKVTVKNNSFIRKIMIE